MNRWLYRSCFMGVVMTASFMVSSGTALADAPSSCSGPYDPYQYAAAADQACGQTTSTSRTVIALADGGSRVDYALPGYGTASVYDPPANIDWATASSALRAEYAIPQPPPASEGIPAMIQWQVFVSGLKQPAAPSPFLAISQSTAPAPATASNAVAADSSPTWSGYVASGNFTQSDMNWIEPTYGSSCTNSATVIWAGIGGLNGNSDLGQDGTAYGSEGIGNHEAWWEILPKPSNVGSGIVSLNFSIPAKDHAYAETDWGGGKYSGTVEDGTTGKFQSWSDSGSYGGQTGDAIVERPTGSAGPDPLANFQTVQIDGSTENAQAMNSYSNTLINMFNGSDQLDTTTGLGSGGSFSVTYGRCS